MKENMRSSSSVTTNYAYNSRRRRRTTRNADSRNWFLENETWLRKHDLIGQGSEDSDDDDETSYKAKYNERQRQIIETLKLAVDLIESDESDELQLFSLLNSDHRPCSRLEGENDNDGEQAFGDTKESEFGFKIICQDLLDMDRSKFEQCNLTVLNLSKTHLGCDGAEALAKCFQSKTSIIPSKLRTLDLSKNRLDDKGVATLAESISRSQLETLNLADNGIGPIGARAIAKILQVSPSQLTTLDVQDNHIGDEGVAAISAPLFVRSSSCPLRSLNLSLNDIGPYGIRALMKAYQSKFVTFQELYFSENRLEDEGATEIANSLLQKKCRDGVPLKILHLCGNEIGPKGVSALSEALQSTKCRMEALNVSNNDIGDDGLRSLLDVVHNKDCELSSLYLNDTDISRRGIIMLAEALQLEDASNLRLLSLAENYIFGSDEATILASGLENNKSLHTLLLTDTNLDNDGMLDFINAMEYFNTTLTEIELPTDMEVSVASKQALEGLLTRNKAMELFRTDEAWLVQNGYLTGDHGLVDEAEFSSEFDSDSFQRMLQVHEWTRSMLDGRVKEMDLCRQQIGDYECRGLVRCLESRENRVQLLRLCTNDIGPVGVTFLANSLESQWSRLRVLDISMNPIGDDGMSAISEVIRSGISLVEVLRMENCQLSDVGVALIAKGLQSSVVKLQELSLALNSIGDASAKNLATALRRNTTLEVLDLSKTDISDKGAISLISSIKEKNTTLSVLEISRVGSTLSEGVVKELSDMLSRNAAIYHHREQVGIYGFSFYITEDETANGSPRFKWRDANIWDLDHADGILCKTFHESLETAIEEAEAEIKGSTQFQTNSLHSVIRELIVAVDEGQKRSPIHMIAGKVSAAAFNLCSYFADELQVDLSIVDAQGRTVIDIATFNENPAFSQWANWWGTEFGRYFIEGGQGLDSEPEYRSENCVVYYALDRSLPKYHENYRVVLKFMIWRYQFYREIRNRSNKGKVPEPDVDIPFGAARFSEDYVVPLLRYHKFDNGKTSKCMFAGVLVMAVGDRSLEQSLQEEGILGDLEQISIVATDIASSLHHIHENGIIHGDLSPRNIVELGGSWKIIDFDASLDCCQADSESSQVEKTSNGYIPPEVARKQLSQTEARAMGKRLEKFERIKETIGATRWATKYAPKVRELERKLKRLQNVSKEQSQMSLLGDIWSYGVILYQLLVGKKPCFFEDSEQIDVDSLLTWKGLSTKDEELLIRHFKRSTIRRKEEAIAVLCLCMAADPSKRASSMGQVLSLPFFQKSSVVKKRHQKNHAISSERQHVTTPTNSFDRTKSKPEMPPGSPDQVVEFDIERLKVPHTALAGPPAKPTTDGTPAEPSARQENLIEPAGTENSGSQATGTLNLPAPKPIPDSPPAASPTEEEVDTVDTSGTNSSEIQDRTHIFQDEETRCLSFDQSGVVVITSAPGSPEPYNVASGEEAKVSIEHEFDSDLSETGEEEVEDPNKEILGFDNFETNEESKVPIEDNRGVAVVVPDLLREESNGENDPKVSRHHNVVQDAFVGETDMEEGDSKRAAAATTTDDRPNPVVQANMQGKKSLEFDHEVKPPQPTNNSKPKQRSQQNRDIEEAALYAMAGNQIEKLSKLFEDRLANVSSIFQQEIDKLHNLLEEIRDGIVVIPEVPSAAKAPPINRTQKMDRGAGTALIGDDYDDSCYSSDDYSDSDSSSSSDASTIRHHRGRDRRPRSLPRSLQQKRQRRQNHHRQQPKNIEQQRSSPSITCTCCGYSCTWLCDIF